MKSDTNIKKRIMRRVYLIYLIREIFSPLLVKLYISIVLLWSASIFVSWKDVFMNIGEVLGSGGFGDYFVSAFLETEIFVQVLCVIVSVLFLWVARDIVVYRKGYGQYV